MSYQSTTYSFDDVDVVFSHPSVGVHQINGQGVGTITVTMQTEKTQHDIASDGSVMISKIPGDNANIDIEIQQTSAFHKWLVNYYNFINGSDANLWAAASILIRDRIGGATINCIDVSPAMRAAKTYTAQGGRVTWNFKAGNCTEQPFV